MNSNHYLNLTIENFKCFQAPKTFDFGRITLLTGANNSGKTSVLNALLGVFQSEDFPNHFSTNGYYVNMGDFTDIVYNHDDSLEVRLDTGFNLGYRAYNIPSAWIKNSITGLPVNKKKDKRDNSIIRPHYLTEINYISAFRIPPERTYLEQSKANYSVGKNGEGFLDQILDWQTHNADELKVLVSIMKELQLIDDIKMQRLGGARYELLVKTTGSDVWTALSDVGVGVAQFLPIIVADSQLGKKSTLMLAEPETHLHPSAQSNFGQYLVNKINDTEKNYIIETHSEYLINKLRLEIVKGTIASDDVVVYFLEKQGRDTAVFPVTFTKDGQIQGAPPNFFKTYMMEVMEIAIHAAT